MTVPSSIPRVRETALVFPCGGSSLVGVVSHAPTPGDLGLVLLVGGPQYRAGSHRQYVDLARAAAAAGVTTLRFDFRGLGDSEGELLDFKQGLQGDDIAAAIDALQAACPGIRRIALWGLCGGATAALLYLRSHGDPRVCGLAFANPFLQTLPGLARTQVKHYYARRLFQREFWSNVAGGKLGWSQVSDFLSALRSAIGRQGTHASAPRALAPLTRANYTDACAVSWSAFGGPVLLLMSERDHTARAFDQLCADDHTWGELMRHQPPARVDLAAADHTCSAPEAMQALIHHTCDWLLTLHAHA